MINQVYLAEEGHDTRMRLPHYMAEVPNVQRFLLILIIYEFDSAIS